MISVGYVFFLNTHFGFLVSVLSVLFTSFGISFIWLIDISHLCIVRTNNGLKFIGYFHIQNRQLNINDIKGYEIYEKLDELNGEHKEIQLILKDNRKNIILPKIAYKDYDAVLSIIQESGVEFLGYNKMKYGDLAKRIMPIVYLLSGIFAALVGILKLF